MAMGAKVTIAQVEEVVELGEIDSNRIHTPGIYVQKVVPVSGKFPLAQENQG